mmetsp:Transcript_418/g.691  ORF Transcript_418/g.691 Transcript_418/m.691 type:complete len:422 (+) Transcript_418:55-1320(+)
MKFFFALMISIALSALADETPPCNPESRTFTTKIDLFASELGYYMFEECGDAVNPTLGMEVGETYTFVQKDPTNFYHPLGFAYFPDGAHADKDELEPGITQTPGNDCAATLTCPAPMYMLNGMPLGTYSNDASVANVSTNEDNFGLDDYEPQFFLPIGDWTSLGEFSVKLNFVDASYDKDIFYFCHIHEFMSGRIKLLKDGNPVSTADEPPLGYDYQTVDNEFDEGCGTWGLDPFQLPHAQCPERFVCLDTQDQGFNVDVAQERSGGADSSLEDFARCIDAMDCHMMAKMTTGVNSGSEAALFVHQMIPHHQNAVNMAKTLLKSNKLECDDLSDDETPDCVLEAVIRSIIVDQNHQIQLMRGYLDAMGYQETDDCVVKIPTSSGDSSNTSDDSSKTSGAPLAMQAILLAVAMWAAAASLIY